MTVIRRAQLVIEIDLPKVECCDHCGKPTDKDYERDFPDFEEAAMQAQQGYLSSVDLEVLDATVVYNDECVDL